MVDCRTQLASPASRVNQLAGWARGKWFFVVNACLKLFRVVFRRFFAWSFSMLLEVVFLVVVSPDCGHYISVNVDGVECLDCTKRTGFRWKGCSVHW